MAVKRHMSGCLGVLLVALWGFGPGVPAALAQARGRAFGSDDGDGGSRYRELVVKAVEEFQAGNYPEARNLFQRAHAINPNARTLRGLGFVAFEERNYVETIQLLKLSLVETNKPLTAPQRREVGEVLERADAYVARCVLDVVPVDAEVLVDGQTPVYDEGTLLLDPGAHDITVSAEGKQVTRAVNLDPHENLMLRISVDAGAEEQAEAADPNVVAAQQSAPPTSESTHAPRQGIGARRAVGIAVVGVGAVGLASSLGLTLKARNLRDASLCVAGQCPSLAHKSYYDKAVKFSKAATATAVVGGVAFVTGGLLALWPSRERRAGGVASTTRVTPLVSPSFAGLRVGGAW